MRTLRSIRSCAVALAALGGTALAGSLALPAPAFAGVSVGIGVGVPGPAYYGTYRIRTGACSRPRFAFNHPGRCGYPRFSEPVFIDGAWVSEPLYYRTYGGNRYFWYRGRWVTGHGRWDGHINRTDWRRTWHERGWDRDRDDMRGRDNDRDDMRGRDNERDDMRGRDNERDDMRGRDHDRDDMRGGDRDRDRDHDKDRDNDRDNDRGH